MKTLKNALISLILIVIILIGASRLFNLDLPSIGSSSSSSTAQPSVDTRQNLRYFNFISNVDNKDLSEVLIDYLNNTCQPDDVDLASSYLSTTIEDSSSGTPTTKVVNDSIKVFQNKELGLRIGSSKALGRFGVNLANNYKWNCARIRAVNYHRLKTAPEEDGTFNYSKQSGGSAYSLNGSDNVALPMNEDLKVADEVIEKTFSFDSYQSTLEIVGVVGRPCLLSLELWTDTSLLESEM